MVDTTKLGLPILAASQAQKHVTMNESLYRLDTLVQLSVLDKDLTAPPGSPTEGNAYIVGASATGAWSGHDGKVAAFTTGIWFFHVPKAGWLSWVDDEDTYYSYDGTDWVEFESGGGGDSLPLTGGTLTGDLIIDDDSPTLTFRENDQSSTQDHSRFLSSAGAFFIQNEKGQISFSGYPQTSNDLVTFRVRHSGDWRNIFHEGIFATGSDNVRFGQLGIGGATADTTNVLSMNGPAALFNNAGSGIQLKLNKNAVGDSASFLFQTGFSARAEIGLTGTDDFTFKVSPDGSTFYDGIVVQKDDGKVRFPSGAKVTRRVDLGGRFYMYTDNRWIGFNTNYGISTENHSSSMGTGTEPDIAFTQIGIFMRAGETLKEFVTLIRLSSLDVGGFNFRLMFNHGTPGGASWDTNGETTRVVIHSEDNFLMPDNGWYKFEPSFTDFVAPADGFLLVGFKSTSAPAGTRYLYTNGHFTIITE